MNAYVYGIVISIAIYVVIGNYAGRKVRHLEDYFVAGRNAPTLLIVGTLELRRTLLWPNLLIAGGIALAALMIVFYALPNDAAARPDRRELLSGEALLSLGCGFALIASGLVVRWNLRRLAARGAPRAAEFETPIS